MLVNKKTLAVAAIIGFSFFGFNASAQVAPKTISLEDQKAIKQILGDKFTVTFNQRNLKLGTVKASRMVGSRVNEVGIINADIVVNKNTRGREALDILSRNLDQQSFNKLSAILNKYE